MVNESNAVSDQSGEASGETSQDVVKYETYKKTISELKNVKSKLSEYEAKVREREQIELAEKGKFKEALDSEISRRKELEQELQAKERAFAKKIFTKEVQEIALQFGARKEALEDIIKVGDWHEVEIDENYTINKDQLKSQIANLAKSKPFFFVNTAAAPRDISNVASAAPREKEASEMSIDEIKQKLVSLK